ncbi:MAG TPA: hypothetical protein PKX48_00860 [Planctomycetota bacterium]|jgi:hypothetical protein|nr:hypothetical protein [Planctomycetota bacterium]OQC21970.1 MAG: hypothetical protein BWX69_00276 [Planctomycetes bacterium ADurb.Bin069]HNR98146.1 hypothetical protein [Planctomycetota bacterium]HOE28551.1 hypothetical protein [Planctomycetota bacterium]HOE85690.1 hypothetical protein [Planctomycetota bacterium]
MNRPVPAVFLCAALCAAALSPAASEIKVDAAAREVSLPFTFVDPAQAIEVFACSPGGPTHETVIIFTASGGEIAAALASIGCRPETAWALASPQDFTLTQGDRVLVLLKWDRDGEQFEAAAEDLIWRTGEDLPEFVHGFSYAGRTIKAGDPPRERIPDTVEITVGGAGRQSAVTSLLVHPSAMSFLADHVSALELNPRFADEVGRLAARKRGGTMILRLVTETELLAYRRARTPPIFGLEDILRAHEPLARAIDADKAAYAALGKDLEALLDTPDETARATVQTKLAEASLLAWRIHAAYIAMYAGEWDFQRAILEARLESFRGFAARGHAFLRAFAPERTKLAELRLALLRRSAPDAALELAIRRQEEELRTIQARRDIPGIEAEIAFLESRVKEEEGHAGGFLLAMLKNELEKCRISLRTAQVKVERHTLAARDFALQIDGVEAGRAELAARRAALQAELDVLQARTKLAELEDEIRWAEDDRTSDNAERRRDAEQRLAAHRKAKDTLVAEIEALVKKHAALLGGAAPPEPKG